MTELWRQCAGWLLRLEVLPENHRVVWPDATIEDVAYTLRQENTQPRAEGGITQPLIHLLGTACSYVTWPTPSTRRPST